MYLHTPVRTLVCTPRLQVAIHTPFFSSVSPFSRGCNSSILLARTHQGAGARAKSLIRICRARAWSLSSSRVWHRPWWQRTQRSAPRHVRYQKVHVIDVSRAKFCLSPVPSAFPRSKAVAPDFVPQPFPPWFLRERFPKKLLNLRVRVWGNIAGQLQGLQPFKLVLVQGLTHCHRPDKSPQPNR